MKQVLSILLISVLCLTGCRTPFGKDRLPAEPLGELNLTDAHLQLVLEQYGELSTMRVDIADGLFARGITLQTNDVTIARQLELIEGKLADENIGLFPIDSRRVVAVWLVPETDPAQLYLKRCKALKRVVPLGDLGWEVVRNYWRRVSELQALRTEFEKADRAVRELLMQDDELRAAGERFQAASSGPERAAMERELALVQDRVIARLLEESEAFRAAGQRREEGLYNCNIQTLEYIINDYEKRGKTLPVDWSRLP